ncbi:hypothetical protein [uncultured Limnobacter sp.]|uniref:hypothetical protein n=1 Tax=uncultured Limnobacter sp. TaxID=199681 RepID=UPI0030F58151
MNKSSTYFLSVLALATAACGGGGGDGAAPTSGSGGSGAPVNLSQYRLDSSNNLFLNRNNGEKIAGIILKELLIQGQGVSGKGLGTPFDSGVLQGDSETLGIAHYLVRTFEFAQANFPNTAANSPFCEPGGPAALPVTVTDENSSASFNDGDTVNTGTCTNGQLEFAGDYGISNLVFTGTVSANSAYTVGGSFLVARVSSVGSDFQIEGTDTGTVSITGNASNQKVVVFNGTYGTDYSNLVGGSFQRAAGSSHQSRSITVTYTPGTTYTVEGGYDFVGNFDAIFNQTNSSFEFDVRNLDINGSAVDGSLTSGVFEVNGAGNTKLVFTLRNDGTLVFTVDEDGNGSTDFSSTPVQLNAVLQNFTF